MDKRKIMDEAALFASMQEGDFKALNTLFKLHAKQLYAYALGIIHHQGEAEDMVQEAFIALWKNRDKLSFTGSVWGYLMQSVKNMCIDYKMHAEVEKKYCEEAAKNEGEQTETLTDTQEELYRKVQRVIGRLPERCRQAFILGCIEELSYKEIAEQMGTSVNTVKTQIKTTYKKIREELGKEDTAGAVILLNMLLKHLPE